LPSWSHAPSTSSGRAFDSPRAPVILSARPAPRAAQSKGALCGGSSHPRRPSAVQRPSRARALCTSREASQADTAST
jgi:hypothetical protein